MLPCIHALRLPCIHALRLPCSPAPPHLRSDAGRVRDAGADVPGRAGDGGQGEESAGHATAGDEGELALGQSLELPAEVRQDQLAGETQSLIAIGLRSGS